MNDTRQSRWKAGYARYAIAGFLALTGAAGLLILGLAREAGLQQASFIPTAPPSGLQHVGSSQHGSEDEDYLTREERFARQATPPTLVGPRHGTMTVATTSYRVGLVDPDLEGRLSGEVYDSDVGKPQARRITIRSHHGVLEVFPPKRPEGSQHNLLVLTWIERPGVYIQIRGVYLTEQQLLETANSLREQ